MNYLSKAGKGTPKRAKYRKVVAQIHERIKNWREGFAHQQSRKIINQYGVICIENLSVNRMVHHHCLAKSIMNAAWSQFAQYLSYKAEEGGKTLAKANPVIRHTGLPLVRTPASAQACQPPLPLFLLWFGNVSRSKWCSQYFGTGAIVPGAW
nr:IS200/IS605 family element transposase accessory protein TnpB [Nitrosococcus halophilus]